MVLCAGLMHDVSYHSVPSFKSRGTKMGKTSRGDWGSYAVSLQMMIDSKTAILVSY